MVHFLLCFPVNGKDYNSPSYQREKEELSLVIIECRFADTVEMLILK